MKEVKVGKEDQDHKDDYNQLTLLITSVTDTEKHESF